MTDERDSAALAPAELAPRGPSPARRKLVWALWFGGMVGTIALVAYLGFDEILAAVAGAGWGLLWVTLYRIAPLGLATLGWREVILEEPRPGILALFKLRWIAESVNNLLPVGQVGGDFVRARLLVARGISRESSASSVVADVSAGLLSEVILVLAGLLLLGMTGSGAPAPAAAGGALFLLLVLLVFFWVQRRGLFQIFGKALRRVGLGGGFLRDGGGASIDRAVNEVYAERGRFFRCVAWRLGGWVLGCGEVWLALRALDAERGIADAVLLESLSQGIRTVAFIIPGALGAQEGGLVLLGSLVGLSPETSLSLSLVKRVRELLLGIPALVAWQLAEAGSLRRAPR